MTIQKSQCYLLHVINNKINADINYTLNSIILFIDEKRERQILTSKKLLLFF